MGVLQFQTKRSRKLVLLSSNGVLLVGGLPRGDSDLRAPFLSLLAGEFFLLTWTPFFHTLKAPFFKSRGPSFISS
nr:MAG TPA: hypothetical protein [Siphoviridae sp. ctngg6]